MIRLLALFLTLLLLASQASAQVKPPSCWPTLTGQGLVIGTQGGQFAGRWAAWWCPDAWGDWWRAIVVERAGYTPFAPASQGAGLASIAAANWSTNVKQDCDKTADAAIIDLCMAATRAAVATIPLPPWIVRSNGSYATRPTYPLVNGIRSRTSNGIVLVRDASGRPVSCNYAERVVEGGNVYAQVKRTPGTVALCSRSG